MFTFIKAQAVSLTASFIDFTITILMVEWLHYWYVAASVTGTIAGGVTYFLLGRFWVFDAAAKKWMPQMVRYLLVWVGYLVLNAGLVFLITRYGSVNYIVSKLGISIVLGVSYNYLLQKKFVFK